MITPDQAKQLILSGKCNYRSKLVVDGTLDLSEAAGLEKIPPVHCYELLLNQTDIKTLPAGTEVDCLIDLSGCQRLEKLPENLSTGTLNLRGCQSLKRLPEGLNVWFLDLTDCENLTGLPDQATIANGVLRIAGCRNITELPNYVTQLAGLDICDCPEIVHLSSSLQLSGWLDLAKSGLTARPEHLPKTQLRWRGVDIEDWVAFAPETITAKRVLQESNVELRRVLLEQMGNEKFFEEAKAKTLDRDSDTGGQRELLRVPINGDEDIVCLSCFCPSTQRHYFLRVPPDTKTCHQAAAWMAGFDDPSQYQPVIET